MDEFVIVDSLRARFLAEGSGLPVVLLHGSSLGSSADVWERNLTRLASYGLRVIAVDQPGFGLTDDPQDHSAAYRRRFVVRLMDALVIERAALVGHSAAGSVAVRLALENPERVSRVVAIGATGLLPPAADGAGHGSRARQPDSPHEPTLEQTRALLESNLYDPSILTEEDIRRRHAMSVGKNFLAFGERERLSQSGPADGPPLWDRLNQLPVPLLLVFGRDDPGVQAESLALFRQKYPHLDLQLLDRCKHLVQWDAPEAFVGLAGAFLQPALSPRP